jgi:uncharacterized protein (TIGR02271 family)
MRRYVREGMTVRTSGGEKLGEVVRVGEDTFLVEKGRLLPRQYVLRYEDVAEVRGDEVRLSLGAEELAPLQASRHGGPERVVEVGRLGEPREVVVELAHEEAHPHKVVRETGRLRVRKVVRTEVRHFSIPVRREELVVERLPAGPGTEVPGEAAARGEGAERVPVVETAPFEEEAFVIPLREEQVEFTKTARVWQEVRVSRSVRDEVARVHTPVRREVAEVEERGVVLHEGPVDGLHS